MKLMTKELEERFAKVGRQEYVEDPLVIAKFFFPASPATWLATEYDPEERMFFGYVSLFNDWNNEWGYFSLDELESLVVYGMRVERDLYWRECPLSEAKEKEKIV